MVLLEDEQFFMEGNCSDPIVLKHVREIAVDGRSATPWLSVKEKIPARIEYCVRIVENYQKRCLGGEIDLSSGTEGRALLDMIINKVLSFDDAPFTWRRFCELLYDPLRNYSNAMKYLRALCKVIDVQMTVKESQNLRRLQPEPFQSFTPVRLFFDESNVKSTDRKRVSEDVEEAKKRLKLNVEEDKENDNIQSGGDH
ncbi:hypothetical protein COOONC_02122 [Cooperia oncophora]